MIVTSELLERVKNTTPFDADVITGWDKEARKDFQKTVLPTDLKLHIAYMCGYVCGAVLAQANLSTQTKEDPSGSR